MAGRMSIGPIIGEVARNAPTGGGTQCVRQEAKQEANCQEVIMSQKGWEKVEHVVSPILRNQGAKSTHISYLEVSLVVCLTQEKNFYCGNSQVMYRERAEVLEMYCLWQEAQPATGDTAANLDEILAETIGRFNEKVWDAALKERMKEEEANSRGKKAPKGVKECLWMQEARNMLIDGEYEKLEIIEGEQISVHTAKALKTELLRLSKTSERGTEVTLLRQAIRNELALFRCGMFLVKKKNGKSRIVFDARPANRGIKRLRGLRMFSLEDLLGAVSNLMGKGGLFAWTCDFRHFFYQLRLHALMQRLFGIEGAEGIYFPNVWPMGFHSSPEVAQVISWLTILARRETEDGLGVRSEELQQMPRFLKIYNTQGDAVGYIFVLLDNILVVSCSKNVTQQWSHRILRNISDFNLEVKAEETGFAEIHRGEASNDHPSPGVRDCFTFAGIDFSDRGWRSASGDREVNDTPATRRAAMALAGSLLWDIRVRGESLRSHPALRNLYREVAKHQDDVHSVLWETPFELDNEALAGIKALVERRSRREYTYRERRATKTEKKILAVTDATPTSIAWTIFEELDSPAGNDRRTERSVMLNGQVKWFRVTTAASKVEAADVDYNEALAIAEMIQSTMTRFPKKRLEFRVLTDSSTADAIFTKGYSKAEKFDQLLDNLEELRQRGFKVITSWIPSEANAADTPSRNVLNPTCIGCDRRQTEGCKCERPRWEVDLSLEDSRLEATLKAAMEICRWEDVEKPR